jgi:hypothetical protein
MNPIGHISIFMIAYDLVKQIQFSWLEHGQAVAKGRFGAKPAPALGRAIQPAKSTKFPRDRTIFKPLDGCGL